VCVYPPIHRHALIRTLTSCFACVCLSTNTQAHFGEGTDLVLCLCVYPPIHRRTLMRAMGPPTCASGDTWPTTNPWEPPEKRPSVIRAHSYTTGFTSSKEKTRVSHVLGRPDSLSVCSKWLSRRKGRERCCGWGQTDPWYMTG